MFSSRLQFQYDVREEIFSGMSAMLDIGDPPGQASAAASASTDPNPAQIPEDDADHANFMQLPSQVARVPARSLMERRPSVPPAQ